MTGWSDSFEISGCRLQTSLTTPQRAITVGTDTVGNNGFIMNNISQGYPLMENETATASSTLVIKDNIVK